MKVQIKLDGRQTERWPKLLRDILYMTDTLSKIKVSHKTQQDALARRKKLLKGGETK